MQVLADLFGIPCRLVKGPQYTGSDDVAMNFVRIDDGRYVLFNNMFSVFSCCFHLNSWPKLLFLYLPYFFFFLIHTSKTLYWTSVIISIICT